MNDEGPLARAPAHQFPHPATEATASTKPMRWRILKPAEVRRVAAAFTEERARAVFLTLHLTGLRRQELQNLLWRDVSLSEGTLRVVESKSREGEWLLALSPMLVDLLSDRYRKTPFKADTDYVFAHPQTGARLEPTATENSSRRR